MNEATLRDLPVDMAELCIALEAEASEFPWFLDVVTGAVVLVTDEFDPAEHDGLTVGQIESEPLRFRRVPAGSAEEGLGDMRAFAQQHADPTFRESLELALEAPRAERRFRSVLAWVPGAQEDWHRFRLGRVEGRAREWLRSLGFCPC